MATDAHKTRSRAALRALPAFVALAAIATACVHSPGPERTDSATRYTAQVINPDLTGGLRVPNSNVVLLWGTDGSILRATNGRDWHFAVTPVASDLARVASDTSGKHLFAIGKQGVVLRSEDNGRTWHSVLEAGANVDLKAIAHHATSSTWLIGGTNGALFRSTDSGTSWLRIALPLTGAIETLFVDPSTQAVLLGAEGGIVGRSSDAGASWELTRVAMPAPATPIARFFRHESLLIATSALGRFLTSSDDAGNWTLVQSPTSTYFTDVTFDANRGALVMIGHDATILRTVDGARSWTADTLGSASSRSYLSALHFDDASRSLIVVGHGGTLARSTDGGSTWQRVDARTSDNVEGVVRSGSGLIAFGSGGAILSSSDAGQHWHPLKETLSLYLRDIAQVPGGDALVATGQLGEIIRSRDGVDWQRIALDYPDQHTPPDLRALTASTNGDALIAAGPPGAILRSSATGDRWEIVRWNALEAGRAYPWILKDPSRNAVVTLDARGAMQVSTDDGEQWREIDAQIEAELWHGAVLEGAGVMIAAGKAGAIARSEDAGLRWSSVNAGTDQDLFGSYADETSQRFFLMGQNGTLLRSTDGGLTWRALDSTTRSPLRRMIRDLRSGALTCFGGDGVVLHSKDGESWLRVDSGVSAELRKSVVDPSDGSLLIAGRSGVVLRSSDGGERWRRVPTHTQRHFTSIVARANGDLVAVGERIVHLRRNSQ